MLSSFISQLAQKVLDGCQIDYAEAQRLAEAGDSLEDLLYAANRIRKYYRGNEVDFCSIINAKSGSCSEDCKFCAQSAHYHTAMQEHPLLEGERLLQGARAAQAAGACRYGIVTSGRGIGRTELERICAALGQIGQQTDIPRCASLGRLTPQMVERLKAVGLSRYHHNLETSARFFPNICSTHSYQERLDTVRLVKQAGLEVCCGGIFGLGEGMDDRLELAFTLRELGVDSVPLNFLVPIQGTPLQDRPLLQPREILKIIALFRFILPDKDIKVCGGREACLRDLQSWIYYAGANGGMLGNYLTTLGRPAEEDLQMVRDLGLRVRGKSTVII
jgi:biotin synthase